MFAFMMQSSINRMSTAVRPHEVAHLGALYARSARFYSKHDGSDEVSILLFGCRLRLFASLLLLLLISPEISLIGSSFYMQIRFVGMACG
ncbi:unnamed protein product [Gongylonema pulchrum]|uniref:Secreted protein n=1 Tax=Gongylonema pulchrum TaxID=637853 RepID=A0A183EJR6_9BILA|nr:unnamed protein product [Gongylonema pulchrum]